MQIRNIDKKPPALTSSPTNGNSLSFTATTQDIAVFLVDFRCIPDIVAQRYGI